MVSTCPSPCRVRQMTIRIRISLQKFCESREAAQHANIWFIHTSHGRELLQDGPCSKLHGRGKLVELVRLVPGARPSCPSSIFYGLVPRPPLGPGPTPGRVVVCTVAPCRYSTSKKETAVIDHLATCR